MCRTYVFDSDVRAFLLNIRRLQGVVEGISRHFHSTASKINIFKKSLKYPAACQ